MCVVTFSDGTTVDSESVVISNGILEKPEDNISKLSENSVTEDDLVDIYDIRRNAVDLITDKEADSVRKKAITEKADLLIEIINKKTVEVNTLTADVNSYTIDSVIPSDRADLIDCKNRITELQSSNNLSQQQLKTLSGLAKKCDELIKKIDTSV